MPKERYHHGNLRAALVEATRALICEPGPQGFSLGEAARRAGVSAAAPYRHFAGREEVIAEVARQGFVVFADLLEHAWNEGRPSPITALHNVGRAYLAFARKYPGDYMAMFESGIVLSSTPELQTASDRAMQALTRACEAILARVPEGTAPPARMMSLHVWAMAHGLVELIDRARPGSRAPFSADDLLESGIGLYLAGLGALTRDSTV